MPHPSLAPFKSRGLARQGIVPNGGSPPTLVEYTEVVSNAFLLFVSAPYFWRNPCSSRGISVMHKLLVTACKTISALLLALGSPAVHLQAAVSQTQQTEVKQLVELVREAGMSFATGKIDQSADQVAVVQSRLIKLLETRDPELGRLAKPVYDQLARAHGLLELEGISLKALPEWDALMTGTDARDNPSDVSFQRDIAPWLVSKCGNCHVRGSRGKFSMATYTDLMRGSSAGVVLFAGSSKGNRIVEVIESGDMPRGGGKVSAAELANLTKWIAQGAKIDAAESNTKLGELVSRNSQQSTTKTESEMSSLATNASDEARTLGGSRLISFSDDVAPILIRNCNGCHIDGRRASGNLRMDTFSQLKSTGDNGPIFQRGSATDSLLIRKLRGEAGQRMPAGGRDALSEDEIATIATWLRQGARFDGSNEDTAIRTIAETAWASKADHAQLFERRKADALQRWTRILPDDKPAKVSDSNILILGNLPEATLATTLENFVEASKRTKKLLRLSGDEPLIRGGMAVYVLKSRYDYSEFGLMTENRDLPKNWLGHWQANTVDVYGVLTSSGEMPEGLSDALALQITTGGYLGSFSGVPTWFAEGVARNLVVSTHRRTDPRIRNWQSSLPAAMQKADKSKTLVDGKLDEEAAGLVGMNLTYVMMNRANRKRFDKLIELLEGGQPFDLAMTQTFGPVEAFVKSWLGR